MNRIMLDWTEATPDLRKTRICKAFQFQPGWEFLLDVVETRRALRTLEGQDGFSGSLPDIVLPGRSNEGLPGGQVHGREL